MPTLLHPKYPYLGLGCHFRRNTCGLPRIAARVYCSTPSTALDEPPPPPRLPTSPPLVATTRRASSAPLLDDPSLRSTWSHRAWVAAGCTSVLVSLAKSAIESHTWFEPLVAGLIGYVLADLGSGVYHWAIDNYGDASSPVFGSQIEAFQGHHKWPWTITKRQFANNLYALARAVSFVVLPIDLGVNDPVVHGFVGVCSGCIMFSQQFHAWAHGTKSRLPPLVVALQDAGVLVSRAHHAAHHRPPYNNNYCIVSGAWNKFLDRNKVFETLEMVLFFRFGVRPRSWSEPNSEWTEQVDNPTPLQVTLTQT
ncbi:PREDICTED: fatty acid desaturase 4, chloroplastic-like [Nelumbo nucifera]|uniref:Fatty acid desaturase 4, chloroplastic-like n=2 Tax=Nelumbo nucifera TaxID=4432 RepID=A0A1U8BHE9_NELNU|nr:PREDICTED: fatty acid desaturase 4, chloroplastic-like [Nelumbo nucifera]DAD20527.1 TPA_asm: hypothetical protein HUJ06_021990 [Nelumbo nucifera]